MTASNSATDNTAETSPPPLEVETLRERLLTQVGSRVGGTRGSLSKCATKYRDFLSTVLTASSDDSTVADSIENLKQDLEREVKLYQVEMYKVALMAQAAHLEEEACDREREELDKRIQGCQRDISELRHRWTLEKKKRQNREEYEALAKLANNRPPRRELQEKLDGVRKGMDALAQEEEKNQQEISAREKQFQLLLQCMFDLKATLQENEKDMSQNAEEMHQGNDEEEEEGMIPMDTGL